jgi:hypothetical protein
MAAVLLVQHTYLRSVAGCDCAEVLASGTVCAVAVAQHLTELRAVACRCKLAAA